jgi:hypothetical protein
MVDRELLANGIVWLVRGIAVISISLPLTAADEPWSLVAPVFGPLGAIAVAWGVWRVLAATGRSSWASTLRALALVAVPLRIATELGVLTGNVGLATVDDGGGTTAALTPGPWDAVALVTVAVTFLGVIALARHLNLTLDGVAADRWRQVMFAWSATLVILPISIAAGALELLLLSAATAVTAAALLLLTLMATYRAAEDDELGRDFEQRQPR